MKKVIKRIFLGVFALVIFALGAGIIPSYYSLEVSDYEFENEKIQESVKLVQLSDIHNAEFGKENQRLLKKLKECEPDLIFITGDLINSDENEISPMLDLIKKLREIAPIYFSLGNHEIEYEKRTGIDLTEKLEKAGAKVLEEKFVDVTVKGQKFRIGGLYTVYIPEDYEVHEWGNAKEQAEFLKEMEDTERYKILLSHIPNTWMYSDIHNAEFGKENQRLLKKLKECEPDLIFITGDLINSDENEISPMLDLIKKLREIAPIYFSLGNHEIEYEKRTGIDLTEKLEKAGAKVLEEKFVDVTVKGQKFRIGGLYTVYIPEDYEVHEWGNAKEQAEFLKEMEDTERYKILLSHIPNTWMYYDTAATFDLDLIFTGHAHGGQAILPFVGGLYAPDMGYFPGRLSGVYEKGHTQVILSRGLGSNTEVIPRFNNIPEIVEVELK